MGYGKDYNNCHGIKNGRTAPCKKIGKNRMCIYDSPQESHEAFKKIWPIVYGRFPDHKLAATWSGNDHSYNWLNNVKNAYEKELQKSI